MSDSIRVGLIGTSDWLDFSHLPMLKADPRVELVAICGRNHKRAQEMASKYGIPEVFSDYHELISRSHLHAIVIGTPDDQHYAMTIAALDAGLHVLCEKPLALNATHAKAMYDKAEANGVRHMTFFTWRWMPHYRYMCMNSLSKVHLGGSITAISPFLWDTGATRSTNGGSTAHGRMGSWAISVRICSIWPISSLAMYHA